MLRFKKAASSVAVATVFGIGLFAAPASAHVTVAPAEAKQGGYTTLTFKVPNEKPAVSTNKVEVTFPEAQPLSSVSVMPVPGWTYSVEKAKLSAPVEGEGGSITDRVAKITWEGGTIKPGEFQTFPISAGPLPTTGDKISFKALQTYSDGEVVRWIEEETDGGPEVSKPAPSVKLVSGSDTPAVVNADTPVEIDNESSNGLAIAALVVGGLALLVALGAFTRKARTN